MWRRATRPFRHRARDVAHWRQRRLRSQLRAESHASMKRSHLASAGRERTAARTAVVSPRRHVARVAVRSGLGLVFLALLASVLAGVAALVSLGSLRRGIAALDAAVSAVHAGDKTVALASLATARSDFGHASGGLDQWWADPAELVPGVRQHLLALRAAASVGVEVSSSGLGLAPDLSLSGVRFGPTILSRLSRLGSGLTSTDAVLVHAEHQLSAARSGLLLAPVASRLDSALATVTRARHDALAASEGVAAAQAFLGAGGPRHYFLAIETEAELRGNGGIIGNYGVLSADAGHLKLVRFGRDTQLNAGGNPSTRHLTGPGPYLARYASLEPQLYWQNVLASPDFPMDASVVEQLYPQSGGSPINGVIAVDPAGLADVLSLVGAVSVPSWPVPISSANVTDILLHQQYVTLAGQERVDFLGQVAAAVWSRLDTTALPGVSTLASVLGSAIADKHLMFASTDPVTERTLVALGAAGAMARPAGSDFLAVTNDNASGNKIDYYLRRSISYDVTLQPASSALSGQVTVKLQNLAPSSGQPAYVIGSAASPPVQTGVNRTFVSIYTPWNYTSASVDGHQALLQSGVEAGLDVYSTYVDIPPGGTVTLRLGLTGSLRTSGGYRLELFRQPTVAPDSVTVHVAVPDRWALAAPTGGLVATGSSAAVQLQLVANEMLGVGVTRR